MVVGRHYDFFVDPEIIAGRSAPPTEEAVREVLRGVIDPELHADIVELEMVQRISVSPLGHVEIVIALTIAGCPLRGQIKRDTESRVASIPGVTEVLISFGELTAAQRSNVMARARLKASQNAPDTEIAATTRVLAIASGKGGVGKSSVTANLAAALANLGFHVGVLDADIWGFSIPRMLGMEGRLGGEGGKIEPSTRAIGDKGGVLKVVSMGFLVDDEDKAIMWRGLLLAKAVEEFLTKVRWGELDYLLIDMPPGTGDVQMALGRLLPRAEMLIVTTPALAAQKVAIRVADMARRGYLRVAGVIENMSWFVDPQGQRHELFGSGGGSRLAAETNTPLLAQIPIEPAVSHGGDIGEPAALSLTEPVALAFADLAQRITTSIAPPIDMQGCSARLLQALDAAVALDSAPHTAPERELDGELGNRATTAATSVGTVTATSNMSQGN
jgi:ATP-binding protein involved in chromosome partitioning